MKTILAYGDSLTYGSDPESSSRHAFENRWPNVLQKALGDSVHVIAEGLGGRTTIYDDHCADSDRNGARILPTLLSSHAPLDLVIFMLGTNDLKPTMGGSAFAALSGIKRLVQLVRYHAYPADVDAPDILIVAPPLIIDTADETMSMMFKMAKEESAKLATLYHDYADQAGCGFFDAASVAQASPVDSVHLDAENTRAIGRGLEPIVRMMVGL